MALGGALGSGLGARDAAAFCVTGVAQPYIHLRFTWQAWHNLTSTFVSRGRRGTHATPWRAWVWLGRAWRRGILRWQAWHNLTSTFVSRGRHGTILHPPSFRVAGVALMPLRGALGSGLGARDAAAFCVAGVAQPYIHLRFTWQAWHNLTSTFVSRGRRGTHATPWRAWVWLGRAWRRGILRGRRGTTLHPPSFHVVGMAQSYIHLRFAWQAWHSCHSVARLGLVWARVTPRHFAWQAWHNLTSTFVSHGRRGTISHPPSFCVAGVAPSLTHPLSHTTLSHTIFHTPLCHTPSFTTPSSTHHFVTTLFFTHNFVTHYLWHTIFHTPLCHTPSLTHPLLRTIFVTLHLSHTIFHHTILHTPLCHTPSFTTPCFTHNCVTHHLSPHHLSHPALSHTYTPSSFVTHHLSHSTLSRTAVLTFRSFTTSFAFPSFSVPATTFGAHYWKKLPCGVIRSFNSLTHPQGIDYFNILKFQFRVSNYSQQCVDCSKAYSDVGLSKKWGYLEIVRNRPASEFALEMHGNYGFNMMF